MKQASLMEYGVAVTTIAVSSRTEETEPKLTAVIVKLEPVTIGRCCHCKRRTLLRFCLEYLDDEGAVGMWGDVCGGCVEALSEKLRERAPSKLASGDMLDLLRNKFPEKFVYVEFSDFIVKHGWTQNEAGAYLKMLEKDGVIFKVPGGWRWA